MLDRKQVRPGMKVESSDGKSLGKITQVEDQYFVIEKGIFFTKNYLVRYDEVSFLEGEKARLGFTGDELERSSRNPERVWTPPAPEVIERRAAFGAAEEESRSMKLAEEQIETGRIRKEAGTVQVRKEVVTEQRRVDVPVTREEVRV